MYFQIVCNTICPANAAITQLDRVFGFHPKNGSSNLPSRNQQKDIIMRIQLVKYESTTYRPTPHFMVFSDLTGILVPYRRMYPVELAESDFLCETPNGRTFVSSINFVDSFGWHVDDADRGVCIPVTELKSFYLIIKD